MSERFRKVLFLALGYYFVFGLSNVSYFLPVYYGKGGTITPVQAGWIVSIFYTASIVSRPFLARIISKFGFRRTFAASGMLCIAGSACMAAFSASFWVALGARALLGVATSLYKIGFSTYQGIGFSKEERGRAFALIMVGELLPLMTVAPLADWMIHGGASAFQALYIFVPVLMCIGAALVTPFTPKLAEYSSALAADDREPVSANPFHGMGECFRIPEFRTALLAIFLFSMTDASASFMSSMTASYGLMASFFLSSNALVGVCVRIFGGRLLDAFPRRFIAPFFTVLTASALILASINPTAQTLASLGLLFGFGMGLGFPVHLALVADTVPYSRQAQASAIMWFTIGLNFSIAPLLMGWFQNITGAVVVFRVIVGVALAGALLLSFRNLLQLRPQRLHERT